MNFIEKLISASKKFNSIVCLGLDPIVEDIPEKGSPEEVITKFYQEILNSIIRKGIFPGAVKPNYAFYAQYGIGGIKALVNVISMFKNIGLPVILDVKRGDIGKTAEAYAVEAFDFFNADAVTLSPYMGYDSLLPFINKKPEGGFYILTKTSNKSSSDIQDIEAGGEAIYIHTAKKILQWFTPGIGSVVGATFPEQLGKISRLFIDSGKDIPLLIPGIGAQGGSLEEVLKELKNFKDIRIHRINSSSAINYAYKNHGGIHYSEAAVLALKEFNELIEKAL